MNDKTRYWIEMADYDIETAAAMLETKRYLYVGFMCHQTIEKMLKAYWSAVLTEPPLKIHSLSRLAERTKLAEAMEEEQLSILDTLEPLNIEARYPTYKERLMKSLNEERCKQILSETKQLQEWIKNKLSNWLDSIR